MHSTYTIIHISWVRQQLFYLHGTPHIPVNRTMHCNIEFTNDWRLAATNSWIAAIGPTERLQWKGRLRS